jgi:two-component system response regulator AtoC
MAQVLVVDRTPSVQDALAFVLELDGHDVTLAGDGRQALEHVADRTPDLVLVDPHLPDMRLPMLCSELRRAVPTLPVIVMSMHTVDRSATEMCRPVAFLAKPFSACDLLETVAAHGPTPPIP